MRGDITSEKMQLFENLKKEILLASLILMLFIFDRSSAIDVVEKLIIIFISSKILRNFSHMIARFGKGENNRIYEYTFHALFLLFIVIVIDFQLNEMYCYTFYTFVCLLIFVGAVFYLINKESIIWLQKAKGDLIFAGKTEREADRN